MPARFFFLFQVAATNPSRRIVRLTAAKLPNTFLTLSSERNLDLSLYPIIRLSNSGRIVTLGGSTASPESSPNEKYSSLEWKVSEPDLSSEHLGLHLPGPFEGTTSTRCLRELPARNVRCICVPALQCHLLGREGFVGKQGSRLTPSRGSQSLSFPH